MGRLQTHDLVGGAEIRGLETRPFGNRRIEVPTNDDGLKQRCDARPRVLPTTHRIAGNLLVAWYRDMEVAAALIVGVKRGSVRSLMVARGTNPAPRVGHTPGVTMRAHFGSFRFVCAAVYDRNAKDPSRSRRDRPLYNEQEHGDDFDKGWGHLMGVSGGKSIPLRLGFGSCDSGSRCTCTGLRRLRVGVPPGDGKNTTPSTITSNGISEQPG